MPRFLELPRLLNDPRKPKFWRQRFVIMGIAAICAVSFAGCSHREGVDSKGRPVPPPSSTIQQINMAPPPPLNLPANMPQAEKDQIIAQQQADIANQNAARNRMFATAAAGMKANGQGKN